MDSKNIEYGIFNLRKAVYEGKCAFITPFILEDVYISLFIC